MAESRPTHSFEGGTVCIIGCGPAVDGVLAVELLRPAHLIVTDLHEDVVSKAKGNILQNCVNDSAFQIDAYVSNLCAVLVDRGIQADLIYENLPNLIASSGLAVEERDLSASFFEISELERRSIPLEFDRAMLGLHYQCLKEARGCLRPGGVIVSCIGARIPQTTITDMFRYLGYSPSIVVADLVEQFEAEKVLAEYARVERETPGCRFAFYDLEEGRAQLRELEQRGVKREGLADAMAGLGICFCAQVALQRYSNGLPVAVVGLVVRGEIL